MFGYGLLSNQLRNWYQRIAFVVDGPVMGSLKDRCLKTGSFGHDYGFFLF